jgi:hypothetical protein
MEELRTIVNSESQYNELIETIKNLIDNNKNIDNMYVIDSIQILINRTTNQFMLYSECEEIYFALSN